MSIATTSNSIPHTRRLWPLVVASAVLASVGCSGPLLPQAPVPTSAPNQLFSMQLSADQHSVKIGATVQLQASGITDANTPVSVAPTWRSSDPKTASVSTNGLVTGLKAGTVTVYADVAQPPREATISLRVLGPGETPPPEPDSTDSDLGGAVLPTDGSYTPDPNGLGMDPTGTSTDHTPVAPDPTSLGIGVGTDASLPPGYAAGSPPPDGSGLLIYPLTPRVGVGDRLRLVALQGTDGSGTPITAGWRSSDPTVATVDEAGNVTGVKSGTVTITAGSTSFPGLQASTTLAVVGTVSSSQITGIRVTPSKVTMNVGDTFWLVCDVPTTDGGFDPHVQWQVGDTSIATISDTGQLTALAPGKTVVTATATGYKQGDLSASVPVTVLNSAVGH